MATTIDERLHAADKRTEDLCFALFVAGAVVGLVQLLTPASFALGFEMVAIARNLTETGVYGNPFGVLNTGPTAANPPIYPLFLAVLIKIFRTPSLIYMAAAVSNVVANAFSASFLPRVSRVFYGNVGPGILASFFWLATMPLMPSWDTSFTVVGLLLFCLFSASTLGTGKGFLPALLAGAMAGILFLLNPSSLLIFLPWIAYRAARRRVTPSQTAILLATCFLVISVWAARNYYQLGALVVRTNLGFTLYASNNDCAASSLIADGGHGCYQTHHPTTSLSEAQLLSSLGEVEFDRRRIADTESWIKTHPERFWQLTRERFREFWLPPLYAFPFKALYEHPFKAGMIWVITALSIPGLALMVYRRERVTLFLLAVLLIYPMMYYVVVSDVRYRYPVLWVSLLPAGYFIWQSWIHFSFHRTA